MNHFGGTRPCFGCNGTGTGMVRNVDLGQPCGRCRGTGIEPNACPEHDMFFVRCDDCVALRDTVVDAFAGGHQFVFANPPDMHPGKVVDGEGNTVYDESVAADRLPGNRLMEDAAEELKAPPGDASRTRDPRGSTPEDGVAERFKSAEYAAECLDSYSRACAEIASRREEDADDKLACYELGRAEAYESAAEFIRRHMLEDE